MAEGEASPAMPRESEPVRDAFHRPKRFLVLGCGAIALGLAVAGSVDRTAGGIVILAGWSVAISSLHRLGRAGSTRRAP